MRKEQKFLSAKRLVSISLAIFSLGITFQSCADAKDIIEMEEEKEEDSRNGYLSGRIEYYVRCSYVRNERYKFQNTTEIQYDSNGNVKWEWEDGINGNPIFVHGIQIDFAGSFKVKAGDDIGGYNHIANTWSSFYNYSLYPMMQYEGMDILLTDWDDIIFRVGPDKRIRMECHKDNIPSQANIGFGPIETDDYYSEDDNNFGDDTYCSNSETTYYPYGTWQMFLDFRLIPLSQDPDSVDEIIDDSSEMDMSVYDIMGNKVDRNHLNSGIYFCNGKKILVK